MNTHIRERWVPRIRQHIEIMQTANEAQLQKLGTDPAEMAVQDLHTKLREMPFSFKTSVLMNATGQSCFDRICRSTSSTFKLGEKIDAIVGANFINSGDLGGLSPYKRVCVSLIR